MSNRQTNDKKVEQALGRLRALHPRVIDLSLDRMWTLLDRLGNPEQNLPPVIHVAGTNGKGSTVATLRAIAEASGLLVHTYTSPHLVRFNERIRLASQLIKGDYLCDLVTEVEDATAGCPITFFEATTALALLAFSRTKADLTILEVGLGGRLDATNVIKDPAISVITPIALDHQGFLGSELAQIASEKAGIIKDDRPVVIGPQKSDALLAILRAAGKHNAPTIQYGKDWKVTPATDEGFHYEDRMGKLVLPSPTLAGHHQMINAGSAIAALRHQDRVTIPEAALRAGLGWVRWPARLQSLDQSKLGRHFPKGAHIWLDGGHNPAAAEIIVNFLRRYDPVEVPVRFVIGMMNNKDLQGFITPLARLGGEVIGVPIPGQDNAVLASEVAAAATDAGIPGRVAKDVDSAIKQIAGELPKDKEPVILIAGSLYLAGRVLSDIGWSPQ